MENIGTLTWPTDRHSLAFPERCFRKVCKLASNNRYENLHHRVLTNAKNITWARNFKDVKTCHSAVHYSSHCTGKSIVILAEKMVLGCNTIKEPFNRNMLQKDQVANYHRKRKHLDACRGRNDRLMEDYEVFFLQTRIYRFLKRHKSFGILTRRRRIVNPASVNLKDLHLKFIDL